MDLILSAVFFFLCFAVAVGAANAGSKAVEWWNGRR